MSTGLLTGDLITSATNLQDIIIGSRGGSLGLFSLFKRSKGKRPDAVVESEGQVTFELDGLRFSAPSEVFRLFMDKGIQVLSESVVSPLLRDGVESMLIRDGDYQLESLHKEDASAFGMLPEDDSLQSNEFIVPRQLLTIVQPYLGEGGGKWRFDDGSNTNWYSIEDMGFNQDVQDGVRRFGVGDILECRIKTKQVITSDDRIQTEFAILEVLEHRPPRTPDIQLQFEESESDKPE